MKRPVIDAEAIKEFLEKADPYLSADFLAALSEDLTDRTRAVREDFLDWPRLWDCAPAGRRLNAEQRKTWTKKLEPFLPMLSAGDARGFVAAVAREVVDSPPWLLDWGTYWVHVAWPEQAWWSRWMFLPRSRTGALLLVVDDPTAFEQAPSPDVTYTLVQDATDFLGEVLASTRRLDKVSPPYRAVVALAAVYAVYMFTMASWKMTEEFTQVLPPFPIVMKTLLGLTRWEGKRIGTKGQTH